MSASHLEALVLGVFDQLGVPHEQVEPDVHEAVLDAELARRLGVAEVVRLTAEPEAAAPGSAVELLAFGSPLLDWALERAQALGLVTRAYVEVRSLDADACQAKLLRELELDHVRLAGIEPRGFRLGLVLGVHALVRLTSDLAEELREVVYMDGRTGLPLESWVQPALVHAAPVYAAPALTQRPLAELVAAARAHAEARSAPRLDAMRRDVVSRRARDEERLARYFAEQRADLKRRRLAPDTLGTRMSALEAEEGVRRREVEARSASAVTLSIDRLAFFETPKNVFALELRHFAETLRVQATVDVATGRADPLACPTCGRATLLLVGRRDGAPCCGACRPPVVVAAPVPAPEPRAAAPPEPVAARPSYAEEMQQVADRRRRDFIEASAGTLGARPFWLGFLACASNDAARQAAERGRLLRRLDAEAIAQHLERLFRLPGIRDVAPATKGYTARGAGALVGDRLAGPDAAGPAWGLDELERLVSTAAHLAAGAPRGTCVRSFAPHPDCFTSMLSEAWERSPSGDAETCCLAVPVVILAATPSDYPVMELGVLAAPSASVLGITRVVSGALGLSGKSSWVAPAFICMRPDEDSLRAAARQLRAHVAGRLRALERPPADRLLLPPGGAVPAARAPRRRRS